MKVVMLEAPQSLLDQRRACGLDGRDEMWDGVLHMVPPPGGAHQRMSVAFFRAVVALADARGLETLWETGLFGVAEDYRVPDLMFCRPEHASERGAEGAELVVEIRSPDDETYHKLPFFAALGVREVIVLHPQARTAEVFRLVEADLRPVSADRNGAVRSEVLAISLSTVDGVLRLEWPGGTAEI